MNHQDSQYAEEAGRIRARNPAVAAMVAAYFAGFPVSIPEVSAYGIEIEIAERLLILLQQEAATAKDTATMLGTTEIVARNGEDGRKKVDRAIVIAANGGDWLPPQDGGSPSLGARFGADALR